MQLARLPTVAFPISAQHMALSGHGWKRRCARLRMPKATPFLKAICPEQLIKVRSIKGIRDKLML